MHTKLQNILVATDFSEQCDSAVKVAIKLCRQNGAVLHLLHVMENSGLVSGIDQDISFPAIAREVEAGAREKLCHLYEAVLRTASIPVQLHMLQGVPCGEICRAAEEMPVDLVVMGTHGTTGFRQYFMGTTANSVIRNAVKPVLVIPPDFNKDGFEKILFPVRTVPGIQEKFGYIKPLLKHNSNAAVHIAVITEKGDEAGLLEYKDVLHTMLLYLEQQGVACTREMYSCRDIPGKVLEIAAAEQCDLVVINAIPEQEQTQFFIGAFTRQVINCVRVPVLSYRITAALNTALKKQVVQQVMQSTAGGL